MSATDSSLLRRQIGFFKQILQRHLSNLENVLAQYKIRLEQVQFEHLDNIELESLRNETTTIRTSILHTYNKLNQLHEDWLQLQDSNKNERKLFEDYIQKYGDYRDNIASAVQRLEQLDFLLNSIDTVFTLRGLSIPSDSSEKLSDKDESLPARYTVPHSSSLSRDTSLLNFVDASILSKLELPTFDGNLLDYPEFFARFATLVDNKPQLDDATKFSLLKSCLRGRALHSIQGLSITPGNYHIAKDILKTLYDDKVTMRHIIFTKLSQLPPCDPQGRQLLSLYNQMFSLVRQFTSSSGTHDSQETALGALLLNKLPIFIRSQIYDRTSNSHNITPTELLNLLTDIVRKESTMNAVDFLSRNTTDGHNNNNHGYSVIPINKPTLNRKQNLSVKPSPNSSNSTRLRLQPLRKHCPYCSSSLHGALDCNAFTTPQQRLAQVRNLQLCSNCLSSRHQLKDCPSRIRCTFCSRKHHSSLCFTRSRQSEVKHQQSSSTTQHKPTITQRHSSDQAHSITESSKQETSGEVTCITQPENNASNASMSSTNTQKNPLMCARVTLFNPTDSSKQVTIIAFLDPGSTKSYLLDEVATRLELKPIGHEKVDVSTFANTEPVHLHCTNYTIGLQTTQGDKYLSVRAIPHLTEKIPHVLCLEDRFYGGHCFLDDCSEPALLIGIDYFWEIILSDDFYYQQLSNGYRLLHTTIGHIVVGKQFNLKQLEVASLSTDNLNNPALHDDLSEMVSKFWQLETIGITDDPNCNEDNECLRQFNDTISYDHTTSRYTVQLPFKSNASSLPTNKQLALSRLRRLHQSLQNSPELLQQYHSGITEHLQQGIIELVSDNHPTEKCHYLPHHGVIKGSGTNRSIRRVYDASAKTKGQNSLNEVLYRGPVLLPDLVGILLRIRFYPILISSDIEKAFLMISLHQECRDYTRFFWLRHPTAPPTTDNLVTYRFTRVPFGLISSPFLLAGTIHYHLTEYDTPLTRQILRNKYVDNVFHGVNTVSEGIDFYHISRKIFKKAGMNLRAFISNSSHLNKFFNETVDDGPIQKLLGIKWNIATDTISISFPDPPEHTCWTKRKVLTHIAKIFDPLGFLSPVTLQGKHFLQSLWNEKTSWDDTLSHDTSTKWLEIISSWSSPLTLPRLMFSTKNSTEDSYDLHIFTDASHLALCVVAYIVKYNQNTPPTASFIMSKSRLTPLNKPVTIPRLELAALTMGATLLTFILTHLEVEISRKFLWTDSNVAIAWTKCKGVLPIFIKNRVKVIQENALYARIQHIPGHLNPADIGTRGATMKELSDFPSWWNGPNFLTEKDETKWFNAEENKQVETKNLTPTTSESEPDPTPTFKAVDKAPGYSSPMDLSRFSSWKRLVRTVMIILLFITMKSKKARTHFGQTRVALLDRAEVILFRLAQLLCPPSADEHRQLKLFFCNTTLLWKCKGRIDNANLPPDTITPIFLPRKGRITTLFILNTHTINNHCGVNHTLTLLRQQVWIPKGRATVKRVLHNECYHCKRYRAKPFALPPFPLYPTRRVTPPQYPFENVGMDFLGPMQYKTNDDTTDKYWILLFTCLNCRAIYVDVAVDITTRTTLHILRRFIATVGCPTWILCDNAQTFKTINQCYSSLPEHHIDEDIIDYCVNKRTTMKFIPSLSPWQGGIYEKMVDIFKKSFTHAIARRLLDIETIKTLCKEAEAIVNTRPLTYFSDELGYTPLRPIDFVRPFSKPAGLFPQEYESDWTPYQTTSESLLDNWKQTTAALDRFWQRWTTEYLTTLREQFQTEHSTPRSHENQNPQVGEFVLIHDPVLHRGQWKIGEVIGSNDGFIRSAEIRLPSKRTITRPLNLIYKLEVHPQTSKQQEDNDETSTSGPRSTHPMVTRSRSRTKSLSFLTLMAYITICSTTNVTENRCPENTYNGITILYASNCVSSGLAIAKYSTESRLQFCWIPISCPLGHIRFEVTYSLQPNNNGSLCGEVCKCPNWTTNCSFATGATTTRSQLALLPTDLRTFQPKEVCSFNRTLEEHCDPTKRLGLFNQIQLYDDKLLLVEHLEVIFRRNVTKNDLICIDQKGWKRNPTRRITGTAEFCNSHACHPKPTLFCIYDNPTALLIHNATDYNFNGEIPIKAWGTVAKTYYGYHVSHNKEYESPTISHITSNRFNRSPNFSAQCSKGGFLIHSTNTLDRVQACVRQYCVFLNNLTQQPILFPNSLVMYDYQVSIKVWMSSSLVYEDHISCIAHPICEVLRCTICWEFLYNTQCWTALQILIMSTFFFLILFCLQGISLFGKLLYILLRKIFHIIKLGGTGLYGLIRSKSSGKYQTLPIQRYINRRRRIRPTVIVSLVSAIILIPYTNPCSDTISITGTQASCVITQNIESCTFDMATILTLRPLQQESCLTLRNYQNNIMALLSIKVNGIVFHCKKRIEFFTRDHLITSESVHRCWLAGSCTFDTCDNISPDSRIPEFSDIANNSTGYTYCSMSCGGLLCDGCFPGQPGCLFHRLYATPNSETIYTVFKCPVWEQVVDVEIALLQGELTSTTKLQLRPGQTSVWNDLRFSLIGTITPALPILSSTFINDNVSIALVEQAAKGQLIPNGVGQLQCSTWQDAQSFNCQFAPEICVCSRGTRKVSCQCNSGNMKDRMMISPLPLTSQQYMLAPQQDTVQATINLGSALQMLIVAKNMSINSRIDNSSCTIETSDLVGCYSCLAGAELQLSCTSSAGTTTADIACPDNYLAARCTPTGHINRLLLHFDYSSISVTCNVTCPGGITQLQIKGSLMFVNDGILQNKVEAIQQGRTYPVNIELPTLSSLSNVFNSINLQKWFSNTILSYIVVLLLALLLILFFSRFYFTLLKIPFSSPMKTKVY